ncbi:MAG: DUF3791 domain-containing protein [Bacteroidales bacterium]|nr:DUF3791 domain-containing protein [Bacteroidales bacterium]
MKPYIFQRKVARIIASLSGILGISQIEALSLFYGSKTSEQLHEPRTGLYLMSDLYILEDLLNELNAE